MGLSPVVACLDTAFAAADCVPEEMARWPEKDELLPVKTAAMSFRFEDDCGVDTFSLARDLFSNALWRALLIAAIHDFMSSSEGAWYTRVYWGVITSKQKRLSELRASRTEATRRSMGSMCRSNLSFQFTYSDSLPWSRTIQNLFKVSKGDSTCKASRTCATLFL